MPLEVSLHFIFVCSCVRVCVCVCNDVLNEISLIPSLNIFSSTIDFQMEPLISPMTLAASVRVDSAFIPGYIPMMQCSFTSSVIQVHLSNHFTHLGQSMSSSFCLCVCVCVCVTRNVCMYLCVCFCLCIFVFEYT